MSMSVCVSSLVSWSLTSLFSTNRLYQRRVCLCLSVRPLTYLKDCTSRLHGKLCVTCGRVSVLH